MTANTDEFKRICSRDIAGERQSMHPTHRARVGGIDGSLALSPYW
ncbi:MAG: hypothetical protein JWR80_5100 [Bradyrhizobium sp.]|nr:hypothetical protein [Bradyrhizobium sp.]